MQIYACLEAVGDKAQIISVEKMRYKNMGRSRQGSLLLQKCADTPKSPHTKQKTLPYLSLMQVIYLSPSHRSGQGTQYSQLANLKEIITGRREKEEGDVAGRQTGAKWSNQDFH